MKNLVEYSSEEVPERIKDALRNLAFASHDDFIFVMQWWMKMCAYDDHMMRLDGTAKVDTVASLQMEARRAMYVEMRKFVDRDWLVEIELPVLTKEKPIQPQQSKRGLISENDNARYKRNNKPKPEPKPIKRKPRNTKTGN